MLLLLVLLLLVLLLLLLLLLLRLLAAIVAQSCSPMPGATARGRLARLPMRKHATREDAAVAVMRLWRTSA
jgi:hypothetical protein